MWKNVILALVLVTFMGLQFVSYIYISCYTCNNPQSCQNPWKEVCTDATANATNVWLNSIHGNVPAIGHSEAFKCMNLTYSLNQNNVANYEYLGCYHPEIPVCFLSLNITYNSLNRKCKTCNYDLCNYNPAGTFSSCTYTIVASIVALLLATKSIA